MSTFTVELPSTLSVSFREEIGDKEVNLENKSVEWFLSAISNGLRQSIADATAGKAGTPEGLKAIQAKYERVCVNGEWPAGGGGGGARLSPEDRGLMAFFDATRAPKAKLMTGKLLTERLQSEARKQVILALREQGMSEEEIKTRASDVQDLAVANLEAVKQAFIEGPAAEFVQAERVKDAAKDQASKAGFKVQGLTISLK